MGNYAVAYQDRCHYLNAYAERLGLLIEALDCQIWLLTPANEGRTWSYSVFRSPWNPQILLLPLPPNDPAVKLASSQPFLGRLGLEGWVI